VAGDGRGGDGGAQLELGHGRRKRKEERESRRPKGISEAGIRRRGASSVQLADGDAWHAKMRALPLTRGKTGGTGFQKPVAPILVQSDRKMLS